jgi:hypothetical protein
VPVASSSKRRCAVGSTGAGSAPAQAVTVSCTESSSSDSHPLPAATVPGMVAFEGALVVVLVVEAA